MMVAVQALEETISMKIKTNAGPIFACRHHKRLVLQHLMFGGVGGDSQHKPAKSHR